MGFAAFATAALPFIGSGMDYIASERNRRQQAGDQDEQIQMQKDFAQHGIRWRVEDAEAAGIHPLYALGAQGPSFSPVQVSGGDSYPHFREMGQDLSRAINATRTSNERKLAELSLASAQADLDGKVIDNQIRASQLRTMSEVGPAFPGGDNQDVFSTPWQDPKWSPDTAYSRTMTGGLTPIMPKDTAESLESDIIGSILWRLRNHILPTIGVGPSPDRSQLPKGFNEWVWHPLYQEWQPKRKGKFDLPKFIKRGIEQGKRQWQQRKSDMGGYTGR